MSTQLRPTGIPAVGELPWGMHVSLFYATPSDLLDAVVPFFAAGLEGGERCAWVPSEPSIEDTAVDALRARVRDFDARMARGDLQILGPDEFYLTNEKVDVAAIMAKWAAWDTETHEQGKPGLRVSGNLAWLQRADWTTFADYERALHDFMVARRIITLCTYPLGGAKGTDVLDVAQTHHSVMARRHGKWEILEEAALATAKTELQRVNAVLEARVTDRTNRLRRSERYLEQGERLSHTGSCGWDPVTRDYTYWSA